MIDVDSLRSLGVKASYDKVGGAAKFYLPLDLPFSAASLLDTIAVIEPYADDEWISAALTRKTGMVISVPISGDKLQERIEQMFTASAPLLATPTERDEHIDLLHVDVDDLTVMVDPAQVLTGWQLKRFLWQLPSAEEHCDLRGPELVNMWRLTLEEGGYFALGAKLEGHSVLSESALVQILQPKYGTRCIDYVDLVILPTGADGPISRDSMMVRIHIKGADFPVDFTAMANDLRDNMPEGFSRLLHHMGSFLQMHYEGDACRIAHPQELGTTMHELLRPVFSTIGALPADSARINIYYPNPEGFRPATASQTSVTHFIPIESDR